MKNSTETIKAVAPLFIIVLIAFFTVRYTLTKVNDQSVQIKKFQKENNSLSQKAKVLSTVSVDAQNNVNAVTLALPEANSSLVVVSQLKNSSILNGVKMGNLKAGSEVKDSSGLSRSDIAFEVEGPKPQIIAFLNSISAFAPITVVDKVKLSEVDKVSRASVNVKAFWTAYPKSLPSINESLTDLTEKENKILLEVSDLVAPQFTTSVIDSSGDGRTDPFTQ